ncbi:TPA: extracellular solute-binding protein, partial [Streptococcus agalactiae]
MEKNTWKKLLVSTAALSVVAGGAIAATHSNSVDAASKTTIKLWVPTDSKASYKAIVKKFEKENKGVTVKMIESNDSKAQENVKKDPSKAADVFSLPHDQLGQLVESGVIQEIPEQY